VFVSIPMDLLAEEADVAVPPRLPRPAPAIAGGIGAAAALLASARNPVVVAGNGVGLEPAVAELVEVAEALGAAVYHEPMADGVNFPTGHPLYQGMPAPTAADIRARLAPHDVALIAGARLTLHHYTPVQPVPEGLDVIQLDADPGALGRDFPVSIALLGGLRPTLRALADRLAGAVPGAGDRATRLGAATAERRAELDTRARHRYGEVPLDPLAAVHALAGGLPPGTVVVEEAITAGLLLRQVLRQDRPGSYVHTVGGGLGWGIGAAIGTRMGAPDRPVIAVLGDGCAAFGLQALWTAAHEHVPVTFVVLANGEYRTLKDTLDRNKSRSTEAHRYVGLDLRPPDLDWSAAGRLFGVPVAEPAGTADLAELARGCAGRDGPLLVHVPVTGHG
jgi:benzoylformate decarboxylase